MPGKMPRPSGARHSPCLTRWSARSAVMSSPSKMMLPGLDPAHPGDGSHRRGLAGAVGADQGDDLALGDLERDPVEGLDLAVGEDDVLKLKQHRRATPR